MSTATTTRPPASSAPDASKRGALQRSGDWARRAPLLPALILVVIVTQLPFLVTIVTSFLSWNAYYPDQRGFAGIDNFKTVLSDPDARHAIWVTVTLTLVVVLVSLLLGLVIALLLDRKFLGRGVVRTMMITPFLIVPVAAALLWKHALFNPEYGLLNGLLRGIFGASAPQVDWIGQYPFLAVMLGLAIGRLGCRLPRLVAALTVIALAAASVHAITTVKHDTPAPFNAQIIDSLVPAGACVVGDNVPTLLLANRFTSAVPGCSNLADAYGTTISFDHGYAPGSKAAAHSAAVLAWRDAFSTAEYIILDFAYQGRRIPWRSKYLRSYVRRHFRTLAANPHLILIRRGLKPTRG